MVNNRFLGSIANAIDSAAVGTYLAKRAGGPVFEPLNYGDLADYPAVGIDSAGVLSLIDSSYLSVRSSNIGTDIDSEVSTSGINNLIPDSSGVRSIGNYSKGISNIFLDSSSEIKIGSHSISISSEYILFDGGNAASFPAASGGSSGIAWGGDRAVVFLGDISSGSANNIDYFDITTAGNASDFGDQTTASHDMEGCGNGSRSIFFGFDYAASSSDRSRIEYVTISTPGNASSFGNLTLSTSYRKLCGSASDGTYGLCLGGSSATTTIDYVTIATTGNASDFGDTTEAFWQGGAANDATYAVFGGGLRSSIPSSLLDYVAMATTGNASTFGNLTSARRYTIAGMGNATYGVFAGGGDSNVIEYVTIASTGNATDFGDLSSGLNYSTGTGNATRGVISGGSPVSGHSNTIQYITFDTPSNAADHGDLTQACKQSGSSSGNAS